MELEAKRRAAEHRDLGAGSVAVDLWMNLEECPNDALAGFLTYDTALFREASARRLVEQLATVLRNILAAPNDPVGSLPALDNAQHSLASLLEQCGLEEYLGSFKEKEYAVSIVDSCILLTQCILTERLSAGTIALVLYLHLTRLSSWTSSATTLVWMSEMLVF